MEAHDTPLQSAIYEGRVRHRRYSGDSQNTQKREFTYQVFMVYLDLQELDAVFSKTSWWSLKGFSLAQFRRQDYFDGKQASLYEAVCDQVESATGDRPVGPIRMLTNLRYFGFIINPITCYYCFDKTGKQVKTIVAEVTNTPWGQRCLYVLPVADDIQSELDTPSSNSAKQQLHFAKAMPVSPFQPLDLAYDWYSQTPRDKLTIHIDVVKPSRISSSDVSSESLQSEISHKVLDATMNLARREMTAASMRGVLLRYPLMTAKVCVAIYWQATKLFFKRYKYYPNRTQSDLIVSASKSNN